MQAYRCNLGLNEFSPTIKKMKKLTYAFASLLFVYASASAQVSVNDTQIWGTGEGEDSTYLAPDGRLVVNNLTEQNRTIIVGPSGDLTVNVRTDMAVLPDGWNEDISIIIDGGTLRTNAAFKLPGRLPEGWPEPDGTEALARVILNDGEWFALELESAYSPWRRGQVVVGDGVLWLEQQSTNTNYQVQAMLDIGSLIAADGYELVFQDFDGNTVDPATWTGVNDSMRISAIPEPTTVSILIGLACLGLVLLRRNRR